MKSKFTRGVALATLGLLAFSTLGCGGETKKPRAKPSTSASGSSSKPTDKAAATDSGTAPADSGSSEAPTSGGWGTLSGTFIFDGTPPAQTPVNVTKDVEFCSTQTPLSEQLVVNPENKGIQNIVIMLSLGRGDEAPTPHESYADAAGATISMDNQWCRFEPHVQFVQAGQILEFGNEDKVGHNVKVDAFVNQQINLTVSAGSTLDLPITDAERMPFKVSCTVHPWMTGWVVAQDHPYVAISGDDGAFELKNVPSGTWDFQVWQEKSGYLKQLKVAGKDTKLSRGKWEINVYDEAQDGNAAKNTFGDVLVPASNFE